MIAILSAILGGFIGRIIGAVIAIVVLILWAANCLRTIGTKERPAQGVVTRWKSKAKRVVGPGLLWIWYPIEDVRLFPTHQYQLDFTASKIHSKEVGQYKTAVMDVDTVIYFRWPRWNGNYQIGNGEKKGRDLLMQTFYTLPVDPGDAEEIKDFFQPTVLDAVRRVMATKSHKECREGKKKIEGEIKEYLLSEPGNPFKECAIPPEVLDVSIITISFSDEMEKAFSAPEVGKREAAGEKEHLQAPIKVLTKAGVPPTVAAMFAQKGAAEGLSASELRDFVIIAKLLGVDFGGLLQPPGEGKP